MSELCAEQMYDTLVKEFPNKRFRLYTGSKNRKEKMKDLLEEWSNVDGEWIKYDGVISTLTMSIGVDFKPLWFHCNIVQVSPMGSGLIRDLFQAMHRVRNYIDDEMYYFIDKRRGSAKYGYSISAIEKALEEERKTLTSDKLRYDQMMDVPERLLCNGDGIPKWLQTVRISGEYERTMTECNPELVFKQFMNMCNYKEQNPPEEDDDDATKPKVVERKVATLPELDDVKLGTIYDIELSTIYDIDLGSIYDTDNDTYVDIRTFKDLELRLKKEEIEIDEFYRLATIIFKHEAYYISCKKRDGNASEAELLVLEKHSFRTYIDQLHPDVNKLWKLWIAPNSSNFRNEFFTNLDIALAIKNKGDRDDPELLFKVKLYDLENYYTLAGRRILSRKWATNLMSKLRTVDDYAVSLEDLTKGVSISVDSVIALSKYISENETLIRKEMSLRKSQAINDDKKLTDDVDIKQINGILKSILFVNMKSIRGKESYVVINTKTNRPNTRYRNVVIRYEIEKLKYYASINPLLLK
jgi:hypothetical protein